MPSISSSVSASWWWSSDSSNTCRVRKKAACGFCNDSGKGGKVARSNPTGHHAAQNAKGASNTTPAMNQSCVQSRVPAMVLCGEGETREGGREGGGGRAYNDLSASVGEA